MAIKKYPISNDLSNAAILGAKGVTGGSTTTNATLPTLKQGSVGGDVVDLQNALIKAGYNVGSTGADGKYGANTAAAVKAYQKDNGLTVDGVAGVQTLGNLYIPGSNALTIGVTNGAKIAAGDTNLTPIPKTSKPATRTATKTGAGGGSDNGGGTVDEKPVVPETEPVVPSVDPVVDPTITTATGFEYNPFTNPAAYDEYMSSANNWLSQYENRDPFSYDFNTDALYNQYRDQYVQLGNLAMMDTIGQASAMTGGYGNSYAQMAGQQTYNQYLNQLNEIMPELYDRAYSRYNQEGEDMLKMYSLYKGEADSVYDKAWDQYTTDLGIQHGDYNTQTGYNREDKNTAYDRLVMMAGTDYEPSVEELAAAGMTQGEYDAIKKANKDAVATGGSTGTEEKYEKFDTSVWNTACERETTWNGLESVFQRMTWENINPVNAANMVISHAKNRNIRVTIASIDDLADKMQEAGVSAEVVGYYRDKWLFEFGFIKPENPAQSPNAPVSTGGGGGGTSYLEVR